MKVIAKYQAADGAEFRTEAECVEYEALCAECDALAAGLRPRPNLAGCSFENGAGYVRQLPAAVLGVQRSIAGIVRRYVKDGFAEQHIAYTENADKPTGYTFIGRLINEACPRPVDRLWHRIMCTDGQFREWGQPYYASNPHEAQQVDLTARDSQS